MSLDICVLLANITNAATGTDPAAAWTASRAGSALLWVAERVGVPRPLCVLAAVGCVRRVAREAPPSAPLATFLAAADAWAYDGDLPSAPSLDDLARAVWRDADTKRDSVHFAIGAVRIAESIVATEASDLSPGDHLENCLRNASCYRSRPGPYPDVARQAAFADTVRRLIPYDVVALYAQKATL